MRIIGLFPLELMCIPADERQFQSSALSPWPLHLPYSVRRQTYFK